MTEILNKFEIDIQEEKLWYYIGDNKMEVDQSLKGDGQYSYQKFFQLDRENKDHWINYSVKAAAGKVWVDFWYKKKVVDSSTAEGFRHINYKKRVEKLANNVEVNFDYSDEMIKITDMSLLDERSQKRGYKWVNRVQWEQEHKG